MSDPVLAYASSILGDEGFATAQIAYAPNREMLVAENEYSILALIHVEDVSQIGDAEAVASTKLIEVLGAADLGVKQWDSYLVMLVSGQVPDDGETAERVFDISYNTAYFRRLVRPGIALSRRSVESALSAFRPLERPWLEPQDLSDPSALLEVELLGQGVEADEARAAVQLFRDTGGIGAL